MISDKTYRRPLLAWLAMTAALAGCATVERRRAVVETSDAIVAEDPAAAWASTMTEADAVRMAGLDQAWSEGLAAARRAGFSADIRDEGALLDPANALPRAMLSPGSYRCRIVRLGGARFDARTEGRSGRKARAYTAFSPFFCFVGGEGDQLSLTKQTGSERPGGYLWEDGRDRMVFLGSVAMGDEAGPPAYGDDATRDMVGVLQRVEPFRYRLALPSPRAEVALDVLELVPLVPPELLEPQASN